MASCFVSLHRAKALAKRLGGPRATAAKAEIPGGTVRAAAQMWGVSKSTAARWINDGRLYTTRYNLCKHA